MGPPILSGPESKIQQGALMIQEMRVVNPLLSKLFSDNPEKAPSVLVNSVPVSRKLYLEAVGSFGQAGWTALSL